MNKGLELIEAHHLFQMPASSIDAYVHPQSIVHGIVEFRDGSFIAQLGAPDMRIPISHCLGWPDRIDEPARRLTLRGDVQPDLRGARFRTFSGPAPGARGDRGGRGRTDRPQRGQRGGRGRIPGSPPRFAAIPALVEATFNEAAPDRRGPRAGKRRGGLLPSTKPHEQWPDALLPTVSRG